MDLSEDGEGFVMGYEGWRWGGGSWKKLFVPLSSGGFSLLRVMGPSA